MRMRSIRGIWRPWAVLLALAAPAAVGAGSSPATERLVLPWRESGWTEREAAAHLLDRLAFGARPGEVARVVATGLERWVELQLAAQLPDTELAAKLASLPALAMTPRAIVELYPPGPAVRRRAIDAGVISRQDPGQGEPGASAVPRARREARRKVEAWMEKEGLKDERELVAQSYAQKLLRGVDSENQLAEVMADFWFNHFNVSITDNGVRQHLLSYERDALRPRLFGRFRDLLAATAKHPAMLAYLDNFQSVAEAGQPTTLANQLGRRYERLASRGRPAASAGGRRPGGGDSGGLRQPSRARPNRPQGLNENYARELLELHTLGVDGGYTERDVVEVARAFSGWSFLPAGNLGQEGRARLERVRRAGGVGFVQEGDFLFRADGHDAGEKIVLGVKLAAGRGIEDGEQVLDLVAAHRATARHLARKLAARFVADEPPEGLVDRLAARFIATHGDLAQVLRSLVAAPEFWAPEARGQKIKSPFEVAVSALRALDAEVVNPFPTLVWIGRMGQPLYACPAPTGFPDRADFWVNTGALLARMNFGLELASGRIAGVRFDLARLAGEREPESSAAALDLFARRLLPERDVVSTVTRLTPLLAHPDLPRRVAERAPLPATAAPESEHFGEESAGAMAEATTGALPRGRRGGEGAERRFKGGRGNFERLDFFPRAVAMSPVAEPPTVVAGVVGLVLGSPEFQRR